MSDNWELHEHLAFAQIHFLCGAIVITFYDRSCELREGYRSQLQ